MKYLSICAWAILLSIISSRNIHVVPCRMTFLFFRLKYYSVVVHICFIYLSTSGNLGCLHLSAIVNDAAINTDMPSISGFQWSPLGF